jgi:beta-phosphoglucomutase-like phosphatase (HAD superfamily)
MARTYLRLLRCTLAAAFAAASAPRPPPLFGAPPRRAASASAAAWAPSPAFAAPPPPWAPPPEAILFDCDGVLADTERDGHRVSFNLAFEAGGIREVWDEGRYGELLGVGGGKERMTAHWVSRATIVGRTLRGAMAGLDRVFLNLAAVFSPSPSPSPSPSLQNEVGWPDRFPKGEEERAAKVRELHLRKTDIFMGLVDAGRIPLRPGVLRLVDEAISCGVRLAVCSTSSELAVGNLVRTLMGEERASKIRIFAGDVVRSKKPSPDVYLMAVEEMGLDKSRCVIVEDSRIGVRAAVAAGIACLVTKSSYTADEDFAGARMIVDELGDAVTLETLSGLLPPGGGGGPSAKAAGGNDGGGGPAKKVAVAAPRARGGAPRDRVGHVETAGASWTGARFGDGDVDGPVARAPPETREASGHRRGIGVAMEAHVERGGASWTGARLGEGGGPTRAHSYTPSETHEYRSRGKGPGARWDPAAHVEGDEDAAWTGARFAGDGGGYRRSAPTPSQWRE